MPKVEITFSQRAASLVERSERGIAVLIVRDATEGADTTFYAFSSRADADKKSDEFTATNMQYIDDVFALKQPYKVCVVRIGTSGTVADATAIIEKNVRTGWVTVAEPRPISLRSYRG